MKALEAKVDPGETCFFGPKESEGWSNFGRLVGASMGVESINPCSFRPGCEKYMNLETKSGDG